uniref:Uncharacterized protein n=1 Tax=Romanomermis culicivorax TaxID=13658 RepID=A0A915K574_ROMCU
MMINPTTKYAIDEMQEIIEKRSAWQLSRQKLHSEDEEHSFLAPTCSSASAVIRINAQIGASLNEPLFPATLTIENFGISFTTFNNKTPIDNKVMMPNRNLDSRRSVLLADA